MNGGGNEMTKKEAEGNRKWAKPVVVALEKISGEKWEWEPEVFELFLNADVLYCATEISFTSEPKESWIIEGASDIDGNHFGPFFPEDCFPILHWEEIERALEENNHKTYISINDSGNALCQICFPFKRKGRHNVMAKAGGKSRQEAVCRAVIQLGKEIDAKTK